MWNSLAEFLSYFSWVAGVPLYVTVGVIAVSFIFFGFFEQPFRRIVKRTVSNTLKIFLLASVLPFYVVVLLSLSFLWAFLAMLVSGALILALLFFFTVLDALGMDFLGSTISNLSRFLQGPGYIEFVAMPVVAISLVVAFVLMSIDCFTDIRESYRGSISEDN